MSDELSERLYWLMLEVESDARVALWQLDADHASDYGAERSDEDEALLAEAMAYLNSRGLIADE